MRHPFSHLRVDWLAQEAYGRKVVVELHRLGKEPVVIRKFSSAPEAVAFAKRWLEDRGFEWWCNIDEAQRSGWTHIDLFATGLRD